MRNRFEILLGDVERHTQMKMAAKSHCERELHEQNRLAAKRALSDYCEQVCDLLESSSLLLASVLGRVEQYSDEWDQAGIIRRHLEEVSIVENGDDAIT